MYAMSPLVFFESPTVAHISRASYWRQLATQPLQAAIRHTTTAGGNSPHNHSNTGGSHALDRACARARDHCNCQTSVRACAPKNQNAVDGKSKTKRFGPIRPLKLICWSRV